MQYEELLLKAALDDERFVVVTAENRALIRNLPHLLGRRFIDTGITEQCMVGTAAGLALRGRVPVVHALAAFLSMRAFEFIRTDIGFGDLPVKFSAFIPGFLSDANGPTHQAVEDISLMRGIPNMQVFAPADEDDLLASLPVIWSSNHPSYVRVSTKRGTFNHRKPFEIGKAEVVSTGSDLTILVYGMLFEQAIIAKAELEGDGLSVGLINVRSLKPFDRNALLDAVKQSEFLVTLEDHFKTGGLYSIIAEILLGNNISVKAIPLALDERWFRPGSLEAVLQYEGFTGKQIAQRIRTAMKRNGK